MLIAELSTSNRASEEVDGAQLLGGYNRAGMQAALGLQVVRQDGESGDFSVEFQAGFIGANGKVVWGELATINQDEVNKPFVLTIGPSMMHRWLHRSGAGVIAYAG